ncbi:hypothetical protein TNCV_4980411 [Trichonephila clavipes]|nr:hypothetical protein TNCV_4980411 [Trichonephila clavipes]
MLPVLGKKAVLEWCMKEGLIRSSYVCPKCGKSMELREGMDCPVRWLKYGNPKTGQAKKSGDKWTISIFALDTAATHRVHPCSYFLPHVFRFWLDFAPVVRMACERKLLESEATTRYFVLLKKKGITLF